jgi:hypothetical protein
MSPPPISPKLYHIVHIDRLASIIAGNGLVCDAKMQARKLGGTNIGMPKIKERRLTELTLSSYPDLHVGDCVPFYFCPRSVMLYLISRANSSDMDYHGGQEEIIHLVADMRRTIGWASQNGRRWAFTTSNAGSHYFNDFCNFNDLCKIDWTAVQAVRWQDCKEEKQAEFLLEKEFPWMLVDRIGVFSEAQQRQVSALLLSAAHAHAPTVHVQRNWYY